MANTVNASTPDPPGRCRPGLYRCHLADRGRGLQGDPKIASFSIYGSTLLLYSISGPVPQHSRAGEGDQQAQARSPVDLSADRGQLHATGSAACAGPGADACSGLSGAGGDRHVAGDQATFRSAHPVDHHLAR